MIIKCKSCSRKFVVKDNDIPKEGRVVQCGYCSISWHQMPSLLETESVKESINESLSIDNMEASDGKTYKFLGTQWAQVLPSGKTGLFAKKKIGKELDKLTGRKEEIKISKKKIKKTKELNPSSEIMNNSQQPPDIYRPKEGLGFFGYIFLMIIVAFSLIGFFKTFEKDLISYFPKIEYIYFLLNEQLEYIAESVKNIITLINDLINNY
jgi:predicted Zn finger-like uncharacterized protein